MLSSRCAWIQTYSVKRQNWWPFLLKKQFHKFFYHDSLPLTKNKINRMAIGVRTLYIFHLDFRFINNQPLEFYHLNSLFYWYYLMLSLDGPHKHKTIIIVIIILTPAIVNVHTFIEFETWLWGIGWTASGHKSIKANANGSLIQLHQFCTKH